MGDASIAAASAKLFSHLPPIQGDYIWSFAAELSREAMTATRNMVASSFHKQVLKALRREVVLHEAGTRERLDPIVKSKIIDHYYCRAVGHVKATPRPESIDARLESAMEQLLTDWADLMERVGACPTEDLIYNDRRDVKLPGLMSWMARLQRHRRACVDRMTSSVGSIEEALRRFRSLARAQAPLPFFSWQVKHIAVSNTGLKALLQMAGLLAATDAKQAFEEHFPGLSRLVTASKPFQNYFRTDGVSVSLVLKTQTSERRKRKRHREVEDLPFPQPQPGQRAMGIDPAGDI